MAERNSTTFGKHPRLDGKPGHRIVTPITMGYLEEDGSDIRVRRVRVFDTKGNLKKTFLMDEMGVHFADLSNYPDDNQYLKRATKQKAT